MKKHVFLLLFFSYSLFSQNGLIGDGFGTNNWNDTDCFSASAGNSRILTTTSNGTGNRYFRLVDCWAEEWGQWSPSTNSDTQLSYNTSYDGSNFNENSTSGAFYVSANSSYNYVFKTREGDQSTVGLILFEVQGFIRSVLSVNNTSVVSPGNDYTVTATLDGALSTGQGIYLRYTDDSWATSTIVAMSGSSTTYTANIPSSVNTSGSSISYYVFTSGNSLSIDSSNADFYTINYNNNSNANYSYSVHPLTTSVDFETENSGYSASGSFGSNYRIVFNRINYSLLPNVSNEDGYYWAAEDIPGSLSDPHISIDQIDVSGSTSFRFSLDMTTHYFNHWDNSDELIITYSLDGGPYQNLIWIQSINDSSPAAIDSDFDGIGDCSSLNTLPAMYSGTANGCLVNSSNFKTFTTSSIPLSSNSTLDIKLQFNGLTSQKEGIYIDNIFVYQQTESIFNNFSGDNQWNTPSNWSSGIVPTSRTDVTISSAQTIEAGNSTTAVANNITIDSGGSLTIDPASSLDVSGTLTNNGSIVMQSSSSTSAALKATSISGDGNEIYKYQKYVAGSSTNDLITAPFLGETFSNLVDNNSEVLVQNTSPTTEYLFGPFDNDTGAYLTYDYTTNASATLSAGQGYRAGTASGATLEFTGAFETTDQNVAINVGSDATYGKWNLVGNPFPSYLDLDGFLDDNNTGVLEDVNFAIYAYDGDDSNGGSNWTIYSLNETSNVKIAPGQAFFVASSSGGGSLDFNTSRQTVTGGDDFLQRQAQTIDSSFKLKLESSNSLTHTDFYFNSNTGEGLDIGYDVGTYANLASSFSLYSKLASGEYSETNFAIQTISNDLSETVVIPLGVHTSAGENHSISIEDVSILESINVYLKDYETGILTLLNNGAYSFSTDSNLEGISRFELRLTNTTLGIESDELVTNFKAVYQNDAVVLVGDFMLEDKVEIYDIMGLLTQTHTIKGNHSIEVSKDELATGVYLAKINREGNSKTIKFIIN